MSENVYTEYVVSAAIGLVVSIALIKAGSGPALFKFDEEDEKQDAPVGDTTLHTKGSVDIPVAKGQQIPIINEEYVKKKLAPVQNILGLTDEQMSTAIKDTNEQISSATETTQLDTSDNLNSIVDGAVILAAVIFGFYAINVFSRGDFGRMLAAMFPVEMDSLKLKDYLEKFHFVK